jgi:DNA-binding GntR family transcriptional regulator
VTTRKVGAASQAYHDLRNLAINYDIRPGERINEVAISKQLGVSRTPLREALNRLEGEGFLTFSPKLGFFRRKLEPKEVFDLIEVRAVLESAAARFATLRATPDQIATLKAMAAGIAEQVRDATVFVQVELDEQFHEAIMNLTGNKEMLKRLHIINARVRFIRWGDLERKDAPSLEAMHREQIAAIEAGDPFAAAQVAEQQVLRSMDEIIESVKLGYARIFMKDAVEE